MNTFLLLGDQVHALDAPMVLTTDGEGISLTANGTGCAVHIDRAWDIDTGTVQMGDLRARLHDELTPADATVDSTTLHGVLGMWTMPADSRLCRLRKMFIGTADAELGARLQAAFAKPELPSPDGSIPWTLGSATRFVAATMAQEHGVQTEVVAEGEIDAHTPRGSSRVSLVNIWPDVRDFGMADGHERLRRFARSMCQTAHRSPTERDQITLRLWPYVDQITTRMPDGQPVTLHPATHPVADDLVALYMQDLPESMRTLTREQADAIEPDREVMYQLALTNLMRVVDRIRVLGEGPVFMVTCDGVYEASLALVPEVCAYLDTLIDGPRLIAVPARDLLLVTGDTGTARRTLLAAMAAQKGLSYAITPSIYRWTGDGYTRVTP